MDNLLTIFFDGKNIPVNEIEKHITPSAIERGDYCDLTILGLVDCLVYYRNLHHKRNRPVFLGEIAGENVRRHIASIIDVAPLRIDPRASDAWSGDEIDVDNLGKQFEQGGFVNGREKY